MILEHGTKTDRKNGFLEWASLFGQDHTLKEIGLMVELANDGHITLINMQKDQMGVPTGVMLGGVTEQGHKFIEDYEGERTISGIWAKHGKTILIAIATFLLGIASQKWILK